MDTLSLYMILYYFTAFAENTLTAGSGGCRRRVPQAGARAIGVAVCARVPAPIHGPGQAAEGAAQERRRDACRQKYPVFVLGFWDK
jgi:hypothetical protein